ncbi:hypothetical protein K490DRAFT_41432 [Saccharata proteae CBS 121410]|uniref:Uncharacterized protein n=1 Tax=Saccharata proteae CBS 121410 TaxID=1314787 RepID=A0A9P4HWX6_9PEZI|nr:hypothetical protein K490DRAFT_41432 [Saccharata proteae CBS 121410]
MAKPCWFLAPRACPPDGPIQLGNIIISPEEPDDPLFANTEALPATETVTEFVESDLNFTNMKQVGSRFSLWTGFLQFVLGMGADVSLGQESGNGQALTAREMRTKYFIPSEEYVSRCIRHQHLQDYVRRTRFLGKLYMITGIMEAVDAVSHGSYIKNNNIGMSLSADGTSVGVPVQAGLSAGTTHGSTVQLKSKITSDFVFAFRLRQVRMKKGRVQDHRNFRKGALFDADGDTGKSEQLEMQERMVPVELQGVATSDFKGDTEDMEVFEAFEDSTGAECLCVLPAE